MRQIFNLKKPPPPPAAPQPRVLNLCCYQGARQLLPLCVVHPPALLWRPPFPVRTSSTAAHHQVGNALNIVLFSRQCRTLLCSVCCLNYRLYDARELSFYHIVEKHIALYLEPAQRNLVTRYVQVPKPFQVTNRSPEQMDPYDFSGFLLNSVLETPERFRSANFCRANVS